MEIDKWQSADMVRRAKSNKRLAFLNRFAQEIDFCDLPSNVSPTGISLSASFLLADGHDWQFSKLNGETRAIPSKRMRRIFDRLTLMLSVSAAIENKPGTSKLIARLSFPIGSVEIRENKKSYSIANSFLSRLRFFDFENHEWRSVTSLINEDRLFIVNFSDIQYAYVNGRLVRSAHAKSTLPGLDDIIQTQPNMRLCTSEKGRHKSSVDPTSLFGQIEQINRRANTLLVMDDGPTEWADYIAFSHDDAASELVYYHAKHTGNISLSASVLHEVIGQAEKNIGNVLASTEVLLDRLASTWTKPYKWPAGGTIDRIRQQHANLGAEETIRSVSSNARTVRRVCLVVSSLSRMQLSSLSHKKKMTAHEVQLAWLLTTFLSSCTEMGVQPSILCCP